VTAKDFRIIADILAGDIACHRNTPVAFYAIRNVCLSMADGLARDNPRFDRRKFLLACGLTADDAPMSLS
jgi:hypothetical protein